MNKKQNDILEFLASQDSSKFSSQEEIASKTRISSTETGSECYKLRERGFLESRTTKEGGKPEYRITALGQEQFDNQQIKRQNLSLIKKTTYATIGLMIVTGALAIGTIALAIDSNKQTNLIQQDFDVNNRPWIGGFNVTVSENSVKYDIQNFGKIPNDVGETKFYVVTIENKLSSYSRSQLPMDRFKSNPLTVVMPSQPMSLFFTGDIMNGIEEARNTDKILYLAVILDYSYGDNEHGEYGYVGEYNPHSNSFNMIDSWAK